MKTLAVVERLVELNVRRQRRLSQIVDIKMPQAAELRPERTKHSVVRVAGVARLVRGNAMILIVRPGKVRGIVDVQALSVGLHDVAREAKGRAFGPSHFIFHPGQERKDRQKEKYSKRNNLPR